MLARNGMTPGLCIVSREYPMLFGYLVLVFGRKEVRTPGLLDVLCGLEPAGGTNSGGLDSEQRLPLALEHDSLVVGALVLAL